MMSGTEIMNTIAEALKSDLNSGDIELDIILQIIESIATDISHSMIGFVAEFSDDSTLEFMLDNIFTY